jgi:hypothetical protein
MPQAVVMHEKLGPLFDRLSMHFYADKCMRIAAPPAQTALTDAEGKRLPSLEEIQNLRDHGHYEEAAWWLERRNAALTAAQSASGETK